jgi:hypothetical protein
MCEAHYRQHGAAGGNRLYVPQKRAAKRIEGVPMARVHYNLEDESWVKCPACRERRDVEPDANYECECEACGQKFKCESLF